MPSHPPVDPARVFASLADLVCRGCTAEQMYAAVCVAATMTVPGCDHAGLTVRENGAYTTVAASDPVARHIDQLQGALNEGPCLDAIARDGPQLETDLSVCRRWPALAGRIVAATPVRGALGVRLTIDRQKLGALTVFSDTPNRLGPSSAERAVVLAAFAAAATHAAALGEDAAALRRGLASNRAIGKAVGMLMVLDDVSDGDAFEVLRRTSQQTNLTVADVAADVVRRRGRPQSDNVA